MDTRQIVRLDIGRQPVFGVVGDRDGLVLVVELHHHQRGSEDLDLRDFAVRIGIGDDRRLDEITRRQRPAAAVAADQEAAAATRAAADKVRIPMPASGGFGDGRGLVAALALGADGINMGTRFYATRESPIHPKVKQACIDNDERGSYLIFRNVKNTARVGKSEVAQEVVRRLARPDARFSDVQELVAGTAGRELLETGDMSKGVFWAGMIQGLIHDTPTCAELIGRIVADAEAIVRGGLGNMLVA